MKRMCEDSIRKTVMDQVERSSQLVEEEEVSANIKADSIQRIDHTLSINGVLAVDETGHLEKPPKHHSEPTTLNGKKSISTGTELFDNLEPV
jgi:hypothetical protein